MKTEQTRRTISIFGANGKTTIARMLARVFAEVGQDARIEDDSCAAADSLERRNAVCASPAKVRISVASDDLNCERAPIAVFLDSQINSAIREIGENDDLLLAAMRAAANGFVVLNADDENLVRLANDSEFENTAQNTIYFSLKANHITVKRHLLKGNTIYAARNNRLIEATRFGGETTIIETAEIPATLGGVAEFNVANALAAIAAARAANAEFGDIARGLRRFDAAQHNEGRAQLFEFDGAYVLLDAAHNLRAFRAVCKTARAWSDNVRRVAAIIQAPSDCAAHDAAAEIGRLAARSFDRVVVCSALAENSADDNFAQTICRTIKSEFSGGDCLIAPSESDALRREITRLGENDVLVCFYQDFQVVKNILARCDAAPAARVEAIAFNPNFGLRQA